MVSRPVENHFYVTTEEKLLHGTLLAYNTCTLLKRASALLVFLDTYISECSARPSLSLNSFEFFFLLLLFNLLTFFIVVIIIVVIIIDYNTNMQRFVCFDACDLLILTYQKVNFH